MDNDVVIRLRNVTKTYKLFGSHADRVKETFHPFRKKYHHPFNALTDISMDVRRGEVVGIIGRNGSGKSTLLQIVCRILQPTGGTVDTNGRVAAVLELGTGFNPEYTGRENVFMTGAILGLSRKEIEERFDQIAAFADIGDFIDQKVKIYSSGMFLRLAFAVATCVDPEILVLDEALAVGDISFQHKCMRRIKEMVDEGASVLLVSHSTDTIKRFCQRALWLEKGVNRYFGDAGAAAEKYLAFLRMEASDGSQPFSLEPGLEGELEASQVRREQVELPADSELPTLTALEINQTKIFQKGDWQLMSAEHDGPSALVTWDPKAVASFRFEGNRLKLRFLSHPWSGSVMVILDGRENLIDLYQPNKHTVRSPLFSLDEGIHSVHIQPGPARSQEACQVWWLGGELERSDGRIPFKRDPRLGSISSEVKRYGNEKGRLTAVELLDYETEEPVTEVDFGQKVRLRLHAERLEELDTVIGFSFIVRDSSRIDLFGTTTLDENVRLDPRMRYFSTEFIFEVRLKMGSYSVHAAFVQYNDDLSPGEPLDVIDLGLVFQVMFDPERPVWYLYHEPVDIVANTS